NHWFDFLGADETGWKGLITWTWDLHKDPFPVHYYPPFFLYLNFVFSLILKKLTIFLGIIDFGNLFQHSDFGFIFTLKTGRLLSALFGTFNIYMVYLIGREFFNKYVGISAALLLSVFWPHVIDSHNFKSDVLLTLLITIVAYYALKFLRTKNKFHLFLASIFLGLSVASKFNGAFFGIALLIPLFYLRKEFSIIKGLFYIAAGGVLGFFAGAPNWLVHPVGNVRATLKYLRGLSEEVLWYDPFPSSFLLYGKNLLEHFGIILLLILFAGLVISFIKKEKSGIIISLIILVYFFLAGMQNYLNYRAILPLIPLIALMIGNLIFNDVKTFVRDVRIRRILIAILLIPVSIYSVVNFTRSYKSFDLLKGIASHPVRERPGIGEPDYSAYYIKNHLGDSGRVFREMWTPPGKGLRRVVFGRDVTSVPERMFSGADNFQFLLTSFRTDYILKKAKNNIPVDSARKRLKNYLPFYKVDRPAIFTWSDDIQFWYRKPDYIKGNLRLDKGMPLPRTFVPLNENPSVHLPLQRYEKDPRYGVVKNGIAGKFIFSSRKIRKIGFNYVAKEKLKLMFDVNGTKAVSIIDKGKFTGYVEITAPAPQKFGNIAIRRLYETTIDSEELKSEIYIYKIEIRSNTRNSIPYTFHAEFEGESSVMMSVENSAASSSFIEGEIPGLFSKDKAPVWVRSFFRKTGVDLILLSYINTLDIYENKKGSVNNIDTGHLPSGYGHFRLNVSLTKIVESSLVGKKAELKIIMISGS
ncbi:MAG: glycosyltransferase family 39 protein, partial [Candidatus Aminicenantes bacterium]|nr:glycosyltransferase family 39 protein [Candidatus Aminicenantes bacterium]